MTSNNDGESSHKPHSKSKTPKALISSLCQEAQSFLTILDAEPPPPCNKDQLEREKIFNKVKSQLEDF